MNFSIHECTSEDIDVGVANVIFDSFDGHSLAVNTIYPNNMTEAGRQKAAKFLRVQSLQPGRKWTKVLDVDNNNNVAGVAQYAVFDNLQGGKMPLQSLKAPSDNWDTDDQRDFAEYLYTQSIETQNEVIPEQAKTVICTSFSISQLAATYELYEPSLQQTHSASQVF